MHCGRARRVAPGDESVLEPFRWWHLLNGRQLFYVTVELTGTRRSAYALDVRSSGKQSGDFGMAYVYLDGRQLLRAELPAEFPVEGGVIDVAYGAAGLKRAHYVTPNGIATPLTPEPRSAVGRRMRFARTHPSASRWIGAVSIVLLLAGVIVNGLQLIEPVLQIPPVVERIGRFESPIHLPVWLNVTLGVLAGIGASERALRLRYNWLLDGLGF
ncbi:hypothetical protein [Labedella endophytica]|uniref:hypothetical protein n=1 Tax=Labedella endophytica TaxID=1523160 RepID=UPI001AA08CFB|nr:hypothetical protein [Labedella endophytica]